MKTLIPAEAIRQRVAELAAQIEAYYQGRPVVIVGVLTGCLVFLADLIRQINLPLRIHLIQASSYRGEATIPSELILCLDSLPDLQGREVLLVDDILDTGQTLSRIVAELRRREAASVRVSVLLRKIGRQSVPLEPDYVGFEIPDEFVVGYGLDYNDEYRQLPFIGVLGSERGQV